MKQTQDLVSRTDARSVPLLITAGLLVLGLTVAIGVFVYWNPRALMRSSSWIVQTEEVLNTLQATSQRLDRLNTVSHLYQLSNDESDYRSAASIAVSLKANANHLSYLVKDNQEQASRAALLAGCIEKVTEQLEALHERKQAAGPSSILLCREMVTDLTETERDLLRERTEKARSDSNVSLLAGVAFVSSALLVEVILFGLLIRDAVRRRNDGKTIIEKNQLLEERAQEIQLLAQARDDLQLCVSVLDACASASFFASRIIPESSGAICMVDHSRRMVERVCVWGRESEMAESFPPDACCGLRAGHERWRKPGTAITHCAHFRSEPPEEYACIPMSALGETTGVAYFQCKIESTDRRVQIMEGLLQLAAMSIANIELRHKLEVQSIRDPLTDLFNRRFMEVSLERELSRAARKNTPLAIFLIDADHFKDFNDEFGHEAGDYVLRWIADLLRGSVRTEDIVCRYGGEEFVVILPDISRESAVGRAEYLRRAVADARPRMGSVQLREVTVSIGIAMFPDDGGEAEQLLRAADQNLYRAKQRGRNLTVSGKAMLPSATERSDNPLGPSQA